MDSFDEYLNTDVRCKYRCDWTGKIRDCLGVLGNHLSCPKCGCGVITEKELDKQMDKVNGEESPAEEPTVIIDEKYLINLQSENTTLRKTLENLVGIVEAHELESLSCDRDGQIFCDCLQDAVKEARLTLDNQMVQERDLTK